MRTLALIPARAGSKRIPEKNLQEVNGRSLVERAIICATNTRTLDRIVVSSDDRRVKAIADSYDVPFLLRPAELAQDESPMSGVVRHALDNYDGYDAVCILEPPATFRRPRDIAFAIQLLESRKDATGIRTVTRYNENPPHHVHRIGRGGYLDPVCPEVYNGGFVPVTLYRDDGLVNIVRTERFKETGRLFDATVIAMIMEETMRGLDIDEPKDLVLARMIATRMDRRPYVHGFARGE